MEYEREGVLRSEGKREYLVLGSQELLENSRRRRDGEEKRILDEEAHLRLYRGDRNVTVGLHSLHYGQFHSSMGGSYTH